MSDGNALLIIPNHSVIHHGGQIFIEAAEAHLIGEVKGEFRAIGISAFVESGRNSSLTGGVDEKSLVIYRLNVCVHVGKTFRKIINYLYAVISLPRAIRRHDFIYIFCPGHVGLLASFWCKALRRPYGFYVRGTWLNAHGATPALWRAAFRSAEFMIVTGEAFRRRLIDIGRNVVNEVPLTTVRPNHGHDRSDRLTRGEISILFAGRLTPAKGVLDLIRAVAELRSPPLPEINVIIAGGGTANEVEAVRATSVEVGLESRVQMVGHIDTAGLAKLYKGADIFAFPSYFAEGFPRVLYEAMMFGLPIVTTRMPGLEGFLIDGRNCVYTEAKNPVQLAEKLKSLIADASYGNRLGRRAWEDVNGVFESFTDKSHGEQLVRLVAESNRDLAIESL